MILTIRCLLFCFVIAASALSVSLARADEAQRVRRNFEVEWEPVEGASGYELKLTRKDGSTKPTRIKTKDNKWAATIKPGIYLMQIRSFDDRGAGGEWPPPTELQVKLPSVVQGEPAPHAVIEAGDDTTEEIKLKWEAVPGADKYKVEVHSTTGGWKDEHEVSDPYWNVKVPVGETLEWNVTAIDPKGETGETNAQPIGFEVKGPALAKPNIQKPLSKYIKELEWDPSPKATSYSYELTYRSPKTKKWVKVETKEATDANKLVWNIKRPSGKYRLKVQAHADRRAPSKVQELEFETKGGFKSVDELETARLRDSIVKPTNYYMIASYLFTKINYSATSYEEHDHVTFGALGGTGRVGLGYQDSESKWGGFGIADMSGFTVGGKTFTFAAAEGHLTRKLELGQGGLLLFGTGLFIKELPGVKGNPADGFNGLGKVREIGPHAGFTYWTPISERFGVQVNARAYYTLLGSSFNGGKVQPSLSYQYGVLGSYRLSANWMGLVGYAYRDDNATFSSVGGFSKGQSDSIDVQGDYVNFLLEFSF
jgi:hypothetical protein